MPIKTDLSVSPYFDDFSENKDYYKILFRPGVSVQARELNQLQTLLQKQIERFGDNVFKRGTIVDGCDIRFHESFPYVKIKDVETDGAPVNVAQYVGYNIRNQANIAPLVATITTAIAGFESRNPDLNTLYVRYINSGFSNVGGVRTEEAAFSANQVLTVYDPRSIIEKVTSFNDSAGFSNTDAVVFTSAIAIQNSTGGTTFSPGFYVNDYVNNGGYANAQIVEVDTTSNSEVVILRIKPRAADLKVANSDLWTFSTNDSIRTTNATPSEVAKVVAHVGTGAAATLKTGAQGEVDSITVTSKGSGYYVLPTVTVASPGATEGQIAAANLIPQNYLTTITVANSSVSPVGYGYAVAVGEGVIYQKGYFSRVNEHLVVVEKYGNPSSSPALPDQKCVGFDTTEEIITSNQDQSLLDNATGAPNSTAPGANRLRLTPRLVVLDKAAADANSEFFSIAEFSAGQPYKQNRQTVYNVIGNEMARRTYEESGNYVIDQFILNTKSPSSISTEASKFNILVDPGLAYINGKRVETQRNFELSVDKGTDTIVAEDATISLNYGNYIRLNEVGGAFIFKTGDTVDLYTGASTYTSTYTGAAPSAAGLGTKLGTARIRSFVHESGIPGTATAVYRLYLFDIRLGIARNFKLIRSVFYNGSTVKGIGNVITENGEAVLKDNNLTSLIYSAGAPAVKNANNLSYIYRTSNTQALTIGGTITIGLTGGESFPYTGQLTAEQEADVIVVPLANATSQTNLTGNVTCTTGSTTVTGDGTTFTSQVAAGDFLILDGTVSVQVNNVINNTHLAVKTNPSANKAGVKAKLFFPQYMPISLDRSVRTVNVNATANQMVISLANTIASETQVEVTYNVKTSNTVPVDKTPVRDVYVRLQLSNNSASATGPWVVGVPDLFRLGGVYRGANATFTAAEGEDVTQYFYADHNQTEDYYGTSYLYKKPNANVTITTSDFLLVKFDYFTHSEAGGLKGPGQSGTYDINDGVDLANAKATGRINTLEIPEVYGTKGTYYDLRDVFDFRPNSTSTITPSSSAATAPINPQEPSDTARFNNGDKKFPAPSSALTGKIEYYQGRADRVVIDESGQFHVIKGTPGSFIPPVAPNNALTINTLIIPPAPSLPYQLSAQTIQFVDTKVANEKYQNKRLNMYRVSTPIDAAQRRQLQPRGYTMEEIGNLERRISDLEYYTTFTLVEAMTQKKVIPSSANSSVDRFKFGFFVDGFNDYNYSDISNPGYRAAIVDGYLSPRVEEINLVVQPPRETVQLPYIEYKFVSQSGATDGPVYIPQPNTAGPNTAPANTFNGTITVIPETTVTDPVQQNVIVQYTETVVQQQRTTARSDSFPYVYEEFYYTFSETTGPVEFYINGRDNNLAVAFYQSSTPDSFSETPLITSQTSSPITESDKWSKGLTGLNDGRKIEHPGSMERKSYGPFGGFVEDHFKILFTHNPDAGRYYKVRVYKGKNHGAHGSSGTYGYKLFYPADKSVDPNAQAIVPTYNWSFDYWGMFSYIPVLLPDFSSYYNPDTFATAGAQSSNYTTADQDIDLEITGLKPNTVHTFYLDNVDVTSRVKQDTGLLGAGITSDANGVIKLKLYYGADIVPTTDVEKAAADALKTAGTKAVRIVSADNLSKAEGTIQVPGYVKEENNTPPPPIVPPISVDTTTTTGGGGGGGGIRLERNNVHWF